MNGNESPKSYQTVLMPAIMVKLKAATGEAETKEALSKAVYFAIENIKKNIPSVSESSEHIK